MDKERVEQQDQRKKGDDNMSAAASNYVYKAVVKGNEKPIPPICKEKLDSFKATVEKFTRKK